MAVQGREADAKTGRIGLAEFGNVVGDGARGLRREFAEAIVQKPQQRRLRTGPWGGERRKRFHRLSLCNAIRARATRSAPWLAAGPAAGRAKPWGRGWRGRAASPAFAIAA